MAQTRLTDIEIWTSFKKSEEWAASLIYSENAEQLYYYGLKFTTKTTIIEDAIQDLFVDLIKNRKSIGSTDNILFYLLKSFKRKLLHKIKTEKMFLSDKELQESNFSVTWSIENELILEEISEQKSKILLEALNDLTPRQKEAIYLRFTKELNYKEVAGLMDISVEACRNLISNAISSLKTWISEKGQGLTVFFAVIINERLQQR